MMCAAIRHWEVGQIGHDNSALRLELGRVCDRINLPTMTDNGPEKFIDTGRWARAQHVRHGDYWRVES